MFDDTPSVKWSNAWWKMIAFGYVIPVLIIVVATVCAVSGEAYSFEGGRRYRGSIVAVHGFQAYLIAVAYLGIALASYSYGYMRYHHTYAAYGDVAFGGGFAITAICFVWCTAISLANQGWFQL